MYSQVVKSAIANSKQPANLLLAITLLCSLFIAQNAHADERSFTYSNEVTILPLGIVEVEQWVTWKTDKDTDPSFDRFDFRTEIEFALTEDLQLALYLSDWRYENSASKSEAEWKNVAVELKRNLSDPISDFLGSALYGEVKFGPEKFVLEGKILLQKNFGKWIAVYNAVAEAEWEGENFADDKGVFKQTAGLSYQISPKFSAGAELLWEIEYEDWNTWSDGVLYLGPNASFSQEKWWITITPLIQVTDVASEPNFQTRLIIGLFF